MNKNEAANLIEAVSESLRANPRQFNVEVNIIGYSSTAVGGGTGPTIGTHVTGQLNVSAGGGDVTIALGAANSRLEQAVREAAQVLHEIALEFRAAKPSKSKIKSMAARLPELVPFAVAVMALVDKILDLTGGLR